MKTVMRADHLYPSPVKSSQWAPTQFFTGRMPFLSSNRQCHSTEEKNLTYHEGIKNISGLQMQQQHTPY